MIVRCQGNFPAVGEVLEPFTTAWTVEGWMRGSHHGPLMPVGLKDAHPSRFDGPPRLVALGFQLADGKLIGPNDMFDDPGFDNARDEANNIADYLRKHGPFEPHRLPLEEMEYTTMPLVAKKLEPALAGATTRRPASKHGGADQPKSSRHDAVILRNEGSVLSLTVSPAGRRPGPCRRMPGTGSAQNRVGFFVPQNDAYAGNLSEPSVRLSVETARPDGGATDEEVGACDHRGVFRHRFRCGGGGRADR